MAVEKTLSNISFRNEEKYINGASIAKLLQSMLNTAHGAPEFYVAYQKDTSNFSAVPYGGVLACEIEPFSLRGTLAMTVDLDYKCKVSSQDVAVHARVNRTLEQIIGPVEGKFTVTEKEEGKEHAVEYAFWSNLRYAKPMTDGDVDGAVYPTTYNIKGYIHIVREGGALLSNAVKTYVRIGSKDYEVALRSGSHGVVFNVSNPLKANCFTAATEYISAGYAKTFIVLYKEDEICHALRDFCERKFTDSPFIGETGKPEITIVEKYPDRELITKYYILQLTCERESGAYLSFTLSLGQREETAEASGG